MISKLPFTVDVHLFGLTVVAHRWQHRACTCWKGARRSVDAFNVTQTRHFAINIGRAEMIAVMFLTYAQPLNTVKVVEFSTTCNTDHTHE